LSGRGNETIDLQFDAGPGAVWLGGADLAVVSLGDGLHDGKTEPRAAGLAVASAVCAMEPLEDAGPLLLGDPRTVIGDGEAHPASGQGLNAEADISARLLGVGDRVVDQVAQRLSEAIGVGVKPPIGNGPELQPAVDPDGRGRPQLLDELRQIDLAPIGEVALLGARQQQHVLDESRGAADLAGDDPLHVLNIVG
jgi:hypothetical protein